MMGVAEQDWHATVTLHTYRVYTRSEYYRSMKKKSVRVKYNKKDERFILKNYYILSADRIKK